MIDVLIITALTEEYDAAREIALQTGLDNWHEENKGTALAYLRGRYISRGRTMDVALWRSPRMGGITIGSLVGALIDRLKPRCLAMCGVCAGNPADVALGDVIIAEMTYQYDEGKRDQDGFVGDHRQSPMSSDWVVAAQAFDPSGLVTFGTPTEAESKSWILDRLIARDDPLKHPARARYFEATKWETTIRQMEADDLVHREGLHLLLTDHGRAAAEATRFYKVEPPLKLPFEVKVGPIASGNVVVKDGITWNDLKQQGVRSILGLEMEAATIGNTARELKVPHWVVAKGVMDHADFRKDDRFKLFAARASAEVLLSFLAHQLSPDIVASKSPKSSLVKAAYLVGGETGETSYPDFEQGELNLICTELGRVIAEAGTDLVVCSPFPDAADHHAVRGYVQAHSAGTIHFHSPKGESVAAVRLQLQNMLGKNDTRIMDYFYPAPENAKDKEQWRQAWLLCQLQALETSDVVIAIGGRLSNTASTLLHLAEAKRIPVVPFTFFGGAAARAFERRDWAGVHPGLNAGLLSNKQGIRSAMEIANRLVADRLRSVRTGETSPKTLFISRAATDTAFADSLSIFLQGKGLVPLIGDHEIRDSRMVQPAIEDAILKSDVCVIMWSKSYAVSPWCSDELELAMEREKAGGAKIWLFNLDASTIVPRAARKLPQVVTRTPEALVEAVAALLGDTN